MLNYIFLLFYFIEIILYSKKMLKGGIDSRKKMYYIRDSKHVSGIEPLTYMLPSVVII